MDGELIDADHIPGTTRVPAVPLAQFVVRANGSVRGHDGATPPGALAVTLPYLGRLAVRAGELIGAGLPVAFEAVADTHLSVQVSWNAAEEGTFRALVIPVRPRPRAQVTVVGGTDVDAALAHCVQRMSSVPQVHWSAVMSSESRVVAAAGHDRQLERLPEIGTRVLGVLRTMDDHDRDAWARLDFDGASLLGAAVGRHCLFALAARVEEHEVAPALDEIRAVLSTYDIGSATTLVEVPTPPRGSSAPHAQDERGSAPAPVGARYRRAATDGHRDRSSRRGFWNR